MSQRPLTVLTAALALLVSSPAAIAAPADVHVRIEGAATTLLERSAIRTDTRIVNKDGTAGHDCTGTSAAGALEIATAGSWGGSWFGAFGYSVETILGESHAFPEPDFFSLWINNREAGEGVCGATSELQQGDDVLFFVARCEFDGTACANAPVLPLGLTAPRVVTRGAPFAAGVVEYSSAGVATAVSGATVAGGDAPAQTNAAGVASVRLSAGGPHALKASKAGSARSEAEEVCATNGADGFCGTSTAATQPSAPAATACATNGRDGRCGTRDLTPSHAAIRGISEGQRFDAGRGPRTLHVVADPDASGLLVVKLRLTRNDRGRCSTFSGRSERFVRVGCGARRGFWFGVGDREDTSYLLPSALPRGRYVLDANVVDKAYNRDDGRRRGGNRIVFHVG